MKNTFTRWVFALSVLMLAYTPTSQTYAFDEQSVLRKFQSFAQENNMLLTFKSSEKAADNSLTLKNVDYYDEKTKQRQQIETLVLGNVRASNSGNFTYDSIEISNLQQNLNTPNGTSNVLVERIYFDGLKFPTETGNKASFLPSFSANGEMSNMTITGNDKKAKTKLTFPNGTFKNIEQISLRNVIIQSIELAPAFGTIDRRKDIVNINLGAISFKNTETFGTKGFDIGLIDFGAMGMEFVSRNKENIAISFGGLEVQNFYSPDLSLDDRPLVSNKDLSAEIQPLSVTIDGKNFMGWEKGYGKTINDKANQTTSSKGSIDGLYVDFSAAKKTATNASMLQTLEELNLMQMVLNIKGEGIWARETGLVDISNYSITLEDGAEFLIAARINGYTEQVARAFSKAITTMNAESDNQKRNALGLQALAQVAGLTVERLEIAVDDNSLLNRLIDLQASKLNQDPQQIKGLVGPMTNILLTPYNIPELAAQASQAFGTFMQGGKKLTVVIEPKNGIAITEMIALFSGVRAGATSPADLAQRLNATISAQ